MVNVNINSAVVAVELELLIIMMAIIWQKNHGVYIVINNKSVVYGLGYIQHFLVDFNLK